MSSPTSTNPSRRNFLEVGAVVAAGAIAGTVAHAKEEKIVSANMADLKQSICEWCFKKTWNIEQMCEVAKKLGCVSVELVQPEDWPTLKKHGLTCAIAFSHGFDKGMNNPKYQPECIAKLKKSIDNCADAKFPNVITFTGFREDISDADGMKNCVAAFKQVTKYAEEKGVNVCLEMLNSRVNVEMKGHPGYQGDHIDYCLDIVKQIGSPRFKLLFDFYHVQIMDGDIINYFKKCAPYIGHVHTAGNPGRCELDDAQEINYRAVFKALADAKYDGYIGHEFIPTRDPMGGLQQAVNLVNGKA